MWRQQAFVQAVSRKVSAAQFARFKKMYHEPFFMLSASSATDSGSGASGSSGSIVRFTVSGSAQATYVLTITRAGEVRCSCKDAIMNCRRIGCVCKHACFVLYRVLKRESLALFDDGLRLSASEMDAIAAEVASGRMLQMQEQEASAGSRIDIEALCVRMARGARVDNTTHATNPPDFMTVARPPGEGADCPVCYDVLGGDGGGVRGCPDCGNAVHRDCIVKWIRNAPRATCVYCRSGVWARYDGR